MLTSNTEAEKRVLFLDNLRWLLVLFVIVEHASNAYTQLTWWPVADNDTSMIAGWLSAMTDAMAMPLLFYIAGYFAIPSIQKKGVALFIKAKLKRLGIPWLVCSLTICPVLPLIYHSTRNGMSLTTSYWDLWVTLFKNALDLKIGLIVSMNHLMEYNLFYQRYMWFLSLLILFFLVFSLFYLFRKQWFYRIEPPTQPEIPSALSALKYLLGVGSLTTVCSFAAVGAIFAFGPESSNPEPLFTLANIIQFRPSRLFYFIIYFCLGLVTYRNRWFERGSFPGHFKTWAVSWLSLLIVFLMVTHQIQHGPNHTKEMYGAVYFFILNFLTIAGLGFLTSLGMRYWNRPTVIGDKMAPISYDMYLSHYLIVLIFQLILLMIPGLPGLLKFGLASVLSVICAYITSQFIIKPFPRTSIMALVVMFLLMVLLVRPSSI